MNKKTRRLVKKLLIFIGLLILGSLADCLPDVKLLMDTNQSITEQCNHNEEK